MYGKGQGVPQDYKTAVKWYTLAAEQGFPLAQCNLGLRYPRGQGVIQDNIYAHIWWNIVASSGKSDVSEVYKASSKYLDLVAKDMTPADNSNAQILARECVKKKYKGC